MYTKCSQSVINTNFPQRKKNAQTPQIGLLILALLFVYLFHKSFCFNNFWHFCVNLLWCAERKQKRKENTYFHIVLCSDKSKICIVRISDVIILCVVCIKISEKSNRWANIIQYIEEWSFWKNIPLCDLMRDSILWLVADYLRLLFLKMFTLAFLIKHY